MTSRRLSGRCLDELWPDPDRRDAALTRVLFAVEGMREANRHDPNRPRVALTKDERMALAAMSHGLTRRQAGELLGAPMETVASRLERARMILRSKNTTQAVAVALRQGLIT